MRVTVATIVDRSDLETRSAIDLCHSHRFDAAEPDERALRIGTFIGDVEQSTTAYLLRALALGTHRPSEVIVVDRAGARGPDGPWDIERVDFFLHSPDDGFPVYIVPPLITSEELLACPHTALAFSGVDRTTSFYHADMNTAIVTSRSRHLVMLPHGVLPSLTFVASVHAMNGATGWFDPTRPGCWILPTSVALALNGYEATGGEGCFRARLRCYAKKIGLTLADDNRLACYDAFRGPSEAVEESTLPEWGWRCAGPSLRELSRACRQALDALDKTHADSQEEEEDIFFED